MSDRQIGNEPLNLEALAARLAAVVLSKLTAQRDRLIDRRELANRIGISERAVSSLVARGEFPAGKEVGLKRSAQILGDKGRPEIPKRQRQVSQGVGR